MKPPKDFSRYSEFEDSDREYSGIHADRQENELGIDLATAESLPQGVFVFSPPEADLHTEDRFDSEDRCSGEAEVGRIYKNKNKRLKS